MLGAVQLLWLSPLKEVSLKATHVFVERNTLQFYTDSKSPTHHPVGIQYTIWKNHASIRQSCTN